MMDELGNTGNPGRQANRGRGYRELE